MKIYLDLEANCTTNEAISIGMVTENGDTFYSLIRPHTKLDHNIKVLTGVSQEDADQAPSLEEVMLGVREFLSFPFLMKKILSITTARVIGVFLEFLWALRLI